MGTCNQSCYTVVHSSLMFFFLFNFFSIQHTSDVYFTVEYDLFLDVVYFFS